MNRSTRKPREIRNHSCSQIVCSLYCWLRCNKNHLNVNYARLCVRAAQSKSNPLAKIVQFVQGTEGEWSAFFFTWDYKNHSSVQHLFDIISSRFYQLLLYATKVLRN